MIKMGLVVGQGCGFSL